MLHVQASLTLTWEDERLQDRNLNPCGANWPSVEAAGDEQPSPLDMEHTASGRRELVWDAFWGLDGEGFLNALSVTSLDMEEAGEGRGRGGREDRGDSFSNHFSSQFK